MISTGTAQAEFQLADHAASMERLLSVMQRVNYSAKPDEFLEVISTVFQKIQERKSSAQPPVANQFRQEPSFVLFEKAIEHARVSQSSDLSVLVLGCAEGFAGKSADFTEEVVTNLFGAGERKIRAVNLTPDFFRNFSAESFAGTSLSGTEHGYDLLIAHSVVHFIPDLDAFFRFVRMALTSSGGLILGHEPNARFWCNSECLEAAEHLRSDLSRSKWIAAILGLANRVKLSGPARPGEPTLWDEVNSVLMEQNGFTAPLSENEIRRIVDVHRPEPVPGTFRIGLNGFDIEVLASEYLNDFTLKWSASCGHLGYTPAQSLNPKWRRRDAELAAKYPHDGTVWTAYWRRNPKI
jgi:hypothetical protein